MDWKKIEDAPKNGKVIIGVVGQMVDGRLYTHNTDGDLTPWEPVKQGSPRHFLPFEDGPLGEGDK